jgi:hypothetical protein
MYESKPKSEVRPACHLIVDGKPPTEQVWLINRYGAGCRGYWYPDGGFVAWAALPKMSAEQKVRLNELERQGIDVTMTCGGAK